LLSIDALFVLLLTQTSAMARTTAVQLNKDVVNMECYARPNLTFGSSQEQTNASQSADQEKLLKIAEEVRKQIVTLPQFGVFDNIHFGVSPDRTVVLRGEASRPSLKSSAESVVKKIEGVEKVDNQIEVLPLSPNDDRIRAAVYAAIYGFAPLQKYTSNRSGRRMPSVARAAGGITNDPPIGFHAIRIIVNNGHVTLTGVVDNEADMALAGIRASGVPFVFSVDNQLQVANEVK
jgi:osmotically-inducible protein OsmY